jgi:uncharacterized protein
MRVVLDVNVLISAIISRRGPPGMILDLWEKGRFDLVVSGVILDELERVIHYPRIQQKYKLDEDQIEELLSLLDTKALRIDPSIELYVIERDPTDNRYLECTQAGDASYIVTGDAHLLELEDFEGIPILPPVGFLTILDLEGLEGNNVF